MDDEDFHRDRILWKAAQHNLFSKSCSKFDAIENDRKNYILRKIVLKGIPILIFWFSNDLWTLLSTKEVVSEVNSSINVVLLDSIEKKVKLEDVENSCEQSTKLQSDILLTGESGAKIWAPHGEEIFALMNILRMFPLGRSRTNPPKL